GLVCRVPAARRAWPDGAASARSRVGGRLLALLRFDLGRLLFHHLDEVIDDALILEAVVRHAGNIDLMRIVAATGETDIGFARLARPVDDAADHRERHRRGDMRQALLQDLDRLDDFEILPRAGGARDDADAAPPQSERFQHFVADAD